MIKDTLFMTIASDLKYENSSDESETQEVMPILQEAPLYKSKEVS